MATRKPRILIVDDDFQIIRLIQRSLKPEGFTLLTAQSSSEALQAIKNEHLSLILLGALLPDLDGFTLCEQIREFSLLPIIMIAGCNRDHDKVRGLNAGADDCLTKPFNTEELVARVHALLRRVDFDEQEQEYNEPAQLEIGNVLINHEQQRVFLKGKEIVLTATEYRLLSYLMRNVGRTLTQDLLLEHVWGPEYVGENHTLQVSINRLRHKIEPDPTRPCYIQTRIGIGYTFTRPATLACQAQTTVVQRRA